MTKKRSPSDIVTYVIAGCNKIFIKTNKKIDRYENKNEGKCIESQLKPLNNLSFMLDDLLWFGSKDILITNLHRNCWVFVLGIRDTYFK